MFENQNNNVERNFIGVVDNNELSEKQTNPLQREILETNLMGFNNLKDYSENIGINDLDKKKLFESDLDRITNDDRHL